MNLCNTVRVSCSTGRYNQNEHFLKILEALRKNTIFRKIN